MLGRWPDAAAALARCRAIAREGAGRPGPRGWFRAIEARAAVKLAAALRYDRPAAALALLREELATIEEGARAGSNEPGALGPRDTASALFWLASLEDRVGDRGDDAIRDFRRAVGIYERLLRDEPGDQGIQDALGASQHNIGRLLVEAGRPAEAIELYRRAITIREDVQRRHWADLGAMSNCRGSWHRLGEAYEAIGRYDEALAACQKAMLYAQWLLSRMPEDPGHRGVLDERLRDLARLGRKIGRPAMAVEAARGRGTLRRVDPAAALSLAGDLAVAAVPIRPGESLLPAVLDDPRRHCLAPALRALHEAMGRAGRWSHLAQPLGGPLSRAPHVAGR